MRSCIYLSLFILAFSYRFLMADYKACVTVNTQTGTYTVDPSGCLPCPPMKYYFPEEDDVSFAD